MTTGTPFVLGVELPAEVRKSLADLRRRLEAPGLRFVPPDRLELWLLLPLAPAPEAVDALALATRRIAGRTAPFNVRLGAVQAAPGGDGLAVAVVDASGALTGFLAALREGLGAYGFEMPDVAPCIPLARGPVPEAGLPTLSGELPVGAVRWHPLADPAGPAAGTAELSAPTALEATLAERARDEIDGALRARLAGRARAAPARPRPLLAPALRRPAPAPVDAADDADPDDDTTESESHESDESDATE